MGKLLADLRLARRSAGLSLEQVARTCDMSRAKLSRLERGVHEHIDAAELFCVAESVGLAISLRSFPFGDPIRDVAQNRLLERLHARIAPNLRWATEVPMPIPGDRRAWDAVITGASWFVPVEAETVLDDVQAMKRRIALKARDAGSELVLILVAATPRNRRALAGSAGQFADMPLRTRDVLAALAIGQRPRASGVVLL